MNVAEHVLVNKEPKNLSSYLKKPSQLPERATTCPHPISPLCDLVTVDCTNIKGIEHILLLFLH